MNDLLKVNYDTEQPTVYVCQNISPLNKFYIHNKRPTAGRWKWEQTWIQQWIYTAMIMQNIARSM